MQPIWQDLYDGGVEIVLNGDSHWYERFAPLNAAGQPDASFGVREFIVGTGGQGLETPVAADRLSTSQVIDGSTHGVIKLTLHNGSYDWTFVPDEGTFTDSGTASCHPKPTPPDTTPPTTTVACNGATCAPAYTSSVQVSLAATDNTGGSGVKATYYTTDGSTPTTSSTQYTGPFTVLATSTVSYLSVDNANNAETPKSQLITVDATAPTTTVSCNGAACSAGTYAGAVQVSLTATDNVGGSGVKGTYYTTDGSTPTTASTPYIAPFTVAATSTVKYFSVDNAGNAEGPKSQLITVDAAAPTTTVSCNGAACAAGFYAINVQVSLAATDNAGGSGVAATYYTTNGSTPTTSSTVYTGPFTVASTTHGQVLLGRQRRQRGDPEVTADSNRQDATDDIGALQCSCMRCLVQGRRSGHVAGDRPGRVGSRRDVLHGQRDDADDREHEVHRAVQHHRDYHRAVLLGGRGGQRRGGQVAAHPDRHRRPDDGHRVQRHDVCVRLVHRCGVGDTLGNR